MTDLQFIQASKEFFFQYFIDESLEEKASLLNMEELVEKYKQSIIKDYENANKNRSGNALPATQNHNGSMPDDCTESASEIRKIYENRTF